MVDESTFWAVQSLKWQGAVIAPESLWVLPEPPLPLPLTNEAHECLTSQSMKPQT